MHGYFVFCLTLFFCEYHFCDSVVFILNFIRQEDIEHLGRDLYLRWWEPCFTRGWLNSRYYLFYNLLIQFVSESNPCLGCFLFPPTHRASSPSIPALYFPFDSHYFSFSSISPLLFSCPVSPSTCFLPPPPPPQLSSPRGVNPPQCGIRSDARLPTITPTRLSTRSAYWTIGLT